MLYQLKGQHGEDTIAAFFYGPDCHEYLQANLRAPVTGVWAYGRAFVCTIAEARAMTMDQFCDKVRRASYILEPADTDRGSW